MQILDRREQVLRNKTIPLVKVLWRSHKVEEATWEPKAQMRRQYPQLFSELDIFLPFLLEFSLFISRTKCSKGGRIL